MRKARKSYPSDVSDEEWTFCAPYLTLMKEDAPQREYSLRELFNGLRWFVRAGCPWRMGPGDFHRADGGSRHEENYSLEGCTLISVLTTDDPPVEFAMA